MCLCEMPRGDGVVEACEAANGDEFLRAVDPKRFACGRAAGSGWDVPNDTEIRSFAVVLRAAAGRQALQTVEPIGTGKVSSHRRASRARCRGALRGETRTGGSLDPRCGLRSPTGFHASGMLSGKSELFVAEFPMEVWVVPLLSIAIEQSKTASYIRKVQF